nr:gallate dioxygenase [uncultured Holophaga sp.]
MARIVGGIAFSHTPTIGFAVDHQKQDDPVWAPIFKDFEKVRTWVAERKPDAIVWLYNDHITSFFFDHYSAFALGLDNQFSVADEGGGERRIPSVGGNTKLAQHIGHSLMTEEFDMSFFQGKHLDHGVFSPLSMLQDPADGTMPPIIPLQVGVLQFPIPTPHRCYKLGRALRRAIESYPEDVNVVIAGTGGLSHQVHGERCGFNNTEWDMQFLDLLEKDPQTLTKYTHADYARLGGMEGSEVIVWLAMRAALSAEVKKIHQSYYLPSMTAIATVIYENMASLPPKEEIEDHLRLMKHQLAGVEEIPGTYPFDLARSVKSFRINSFLHEIIRPEFRKRFLQMPEELFEEYKLSEEERDLIRKRDWRGLIHYGAIFFVLEKLGALVGVSNLHIYAAMRGQPFEEFMKTRNAPSALYSVAAKSDDGPAWEKAQDGK